jgi:hypothetical protein
VPKDPEASEQQGQAPRYQSVPAGPPSNKTGEPRAQATPQANRPPASQQFYKKGSFTNNTPTAATITASKNLLLEPINIEDKDKWPLANLIISHFPGKIKKLKDASDSNSL